MNILIVDDQPNVISALKSGIHWSKLGVTQIFTSLNASKAKEIIKMQAIDILLADIEMPVENGLSLLRWCRENHYHLECIFLTSHANFFYAQEAIQLGSTDYILQPARYEDIEIVIRKTIKKISDKKKQENHTSFNQMSLSEKSVFLKGMLTDWFEGSEMNISENLPVLHEMGFLLDEDTPVYLLKFQIISWLEEPLSFSVWSQATQKKITDFFYYNHYTALSYCPNKLAIHVLLYKNSEYDLPFTRYKLQINLLLAQLEETLNCRIALYSAPSLPLSQISSCAKVLRQLSADNVLLEPGIFLYKSEEISKTVSYCSKELLEFFQIQLTSYNTKQVLDAVREYLQQLSANKQLNHDSLFIFCKDFEQMAVQAASHLGLDIHEFPTRNKRQAIDLNFPLTYDSAMIFITSITDYFESAKTMPADSKRCFLRISNYIQQNLDKPLKCADIAHAVYLSPNYANRLVQKEINLSLKEYITQKKMSTARNLLKNTSLSVSAIAVKVGYDNFSHFSQVYKRTMGISPSDERSFSDN